MTSEPSTTTTAAEPSASETKDTVPNNAISDACACCSAGPSEKTTTPTPSQSTGKSRPPLTICKRVCLTTMWTIFGLVFFYLVMVALSTIATGITLDRMEPYGWPRAASRHTAAVTCIVFSLFLAMPPRSLWSLFFSVMTSCAYFCYFVIITSDLRVFADREVIVKMFRTENTHPIFKRLPLHTTHVLGVIGSSAILLIGHERIYGRSLRNRVNRLPLMSACCAAFVWFVCNLYLVDRLIAAILLKKNAEELLYPFYFLTPLWIGGALAAKRQLSPVTISTVTSTSTVTQVKKTE